MNESELKALRDLLDREHERNREAIDRVLKLLAEKGNIAVGALPVARAVTPELVTVGDHVATEREGDQPALIDAIRHLFEVEPLGRWMVPTVEAKLRAKGFRFEAKKPRNSIHTALNRLCERGVIQLIKRGSGRKPNVYNAARPEGAPVTMNGRN